MKNLLVILCFSLALGGHAQYDLEDVKKNSPDNNDGLNFFEIKQRTYVGGELGLSFGPGNTYIHIAPLIGYDITEKFSAGISGMYQLYRLKDLSGKVYNFSTYGAGTFIRFRPIDRIIMQGEFDLFNTVDFAGNTLGRVNVPAALAGIGYAGGDSKTYYQILLMYDFIGNPNMPLPPIILSRVHLKMGMIWHLN